MQARIAALTRAYLTPESEEIVTDLAKSVIKNADEQTAADAEEESKTAS